jgi:hypothetical protein
MQLERIPVQLFPARTQVLAFALCLPLLLGTVLRIQAAAPPPNDSCAGALVVPGSGPFPHWTTVVDASGATTNGDPVSVVAGQNDITNSVWYVFTPSVTGLYTVSVGLDTATDFLGLPVRDEDTLMAIFTATGPCSGFNLFIEDDDSAAPLRSAVSTSLQAGTPYYIVVWVGPITVPLLSGQVLNIQLKVSKPEVPPNDLAAGAEVIPPSGPFPYATKTNDTTLATTDSGLDPVCAPLDLELFPSRDVWYQFTPAVGQTYIFSTGADTATTIEDTLMAIYPSTGGDSIACNDNSFGRAVISTALAANTTYHIVVWDNSPEYIPGETSIQLRVSPALRPDVAILPASSITSTGAVLAGTINPNGLQSRFWFEWGQTASLGSTSQVRILLAGTTTLTTNLPVTTSQLVANTPYYFRLVATNIMGRMQTEPLQTFVWSDVRPALASPVRLANGSFRLEFANGHPGQLYMVQGSTDLADPVWANLGLATNVTGTTFRYTHTGTGLAPDRFYRVRLP